MSKRLLTWVGGIGFSPLQLAPSLWLAADAGLFQDSAKTTPATADADPVGAWADQSGNGKDLTQATGSRRGTLKLALQNGRNIVRFDGVDDFLLTDTLSLAAPLTVYWAGNFRAAGSQYGLDGGSAGLRCYLLQNGGGANVFAAGPNGLTFAATGPMGVTQLTSVINGASSAVYRDGTQVVTGTQTNSTLTGASLGMKQDGVGTPSQVDVYEVIIVAGAAATTTRQQVEAYLKSRWGTP